MQIIISRYYAMANTTSLRKYLVLSYPDLKAALELKDNEFDSHSNSFSTFLDNVRVAGPLPHRKRGNDENQLRDQQEDISHSDFIDYICKNMTSVHYNVTLLNYSSYPTGQIDSKLRFQVNTLKEKEWAKLCNLMGRIRFSEFVMSVKWRYDGSVPVLQLLNKDLLIQLSTKKEYVNKSKMYYHWHSGTFSFNAFNGTSRQILSVILGESKTIMGKIPKRAKKLLTVIAHARKVDSRLDYYRIFHEVVFSGKGVDVFKSASSFEDVLKFVLICVSRVFSDLTFGSRMNNKRLMAAIRQFLRLQRKECYEVCNLVRLLEISSVPWLGKSKLTSSPQDLCLRQNLLQCFMKWLFGCFIVNLVRSFWYVTESHSITQMGTGSVYFPHRSWKVLTDDWIDDYVHNYLKEAVAPRFEGSRYFNHGCLRILPKSNDFRPLCVPCKNLLSIELSASFREAFRIYDWNVIRPLREILRAQQVKVENGICPRNHSTRGVLMHLTCYKDYVFKSERSRPIIYGLKFDMKHCYDNLNQSKIIEVIGDLFAKDPEEEEYFVRRISKSKDLEALHWKLALAITNRLRVSELDVIRFPDRLGNASAISCDDNKIWKFSKGMILDIVKHQVVNSSIELPMSPRKTFKRQRGIFQGTALLATFCDIVYNRLADELFSQIENREESILLRLADDFLFLSTKEESCQKMLYLATSSVTTDYGAYINVDKCSSLNGIQGGIFNFVGLEIDIKTLGVRSYNLQTYRIPRKSQLSFARVLKYLRWNCAVRLNRCQLDLKFINETGIIDNIKDVLDPTFDCIAKFLPRDGDEIQKEMDNLVILCCDVLSVLIKKLVAFNGYEFAFENVYESFIQTMTTKLQSQIPEIQNFI